MYSTDLKERVVAFKLNNNSVSEAAKIFKIGATTVKSWVKEYEANKCFSSCYDSSNRKPRKIDNAAFVEYVNSHNDELQQNIAKAFSCSESAVRKALKRNNLTLKKN